MDIKIENLPKSTAKLTITVPVEKVTETYKHVLEEITRNAEIEGFRKGRAPTELIEKRTDPSKVNGEVVNHLLQYAYPAALKEHHLHAIGTPKVTIKKYEKDQAFEFEAVVATKPEVELGNYRAALKKQAEEKQNDKGEKLGLSVDDVIKAISESAEVEISDLLIEDEVTRMLSRLLQQAETLGITVEQYLSAQNKTHEDLRKEYSGAAEKGLKSEFAMSKAVETEEIKVEDNEVGEAIRAIPDENIRKKVSTGADRWYIISILAKNKLIEKVLKDVLPEAKPSEEKPGENQENKKEE